MMSLGILRRRFSLHCQWFSAEVATGTFSFFLTYTLVSGRGLCTGIELSIWVPRSCAGCMRYKLR
jgi:hypothetical protein